MSPLPHASRQQPNPPGREFLIATSNGLWLLLTVLLTWNHPRWTTVLLAIILWGQWYYRRQPGDGITMLSAALLGTPAEIAEVTIGEWIYHAPDLLWGVPMWIPLIWANLFVLFRRLSRAILTVLDTSRATWRQPLLAVLGTAIGGYWITALLLMPKTPLVIGLYAGFMVLIGAYWNREMERIVFLVGATLGATGELLCVQAGYWHYYQPYFSTLGVDITLPLDWGLSAVLIHRIAVRLTRPGHHRMTHTIPLPKRSL